MNFVFKKPILSKINNNNIYTFALEQTNIPTLEGVRVLNESTFVNVTDYLVKEVLSDSENVMYFTALLNVFLKTIVPYCSISYVLQTIQKIIKHSIHHSNITNEELHAHSTASTDTSTDTFVYKYVPIRICLMNGLFTLYWNVEYIPFIINIPDVSSFNNQEQNQEQEQEQQNVIVTKNTESEQLKIVKVNPTDADIMPVDDIPIDINYSGTFDVNNTSRQYAKQKVKEAHLRAKLASYKAERELSKFMNKYGDELSDSDDDTSSSSESTNSK